MSIYCRLIFRIVFIGAVVASVAAISNGNWSAAWYAWTSAWFAWEWGRAEARADSQGGEA